MSDVLCSKCGEPWDYYGIKTNDTMNSLETEKFLKGMGCPCCDFGKSCPSCHGTGIESIIGCDVCREGKILAWSPQRSARQFKAGEWYQGYSPNVRHLDFDSLRKIKEAEGFHSADGFVRQSWFWCPECGGNKAGEDRIIRCLSCDGTGKLTINKDADFDACQSECSASDEDPVEIMQRRGLI